MSGQAPPGVVAALGGLLYWEHVLFPEREVEGDASLGVGSRAQQERA